jgi:hypothetical protein
LADLLLDGVEQAYAAQDDGCSLGVGLFRFDELPTGMCPASGKLDAICRGRRHGVVCPIAIGLQDTCKLAQHSLGTFLPPTGFQKWAS